MPQRPPGPARPSDVTERRWFHGVARGGFRSCSGKRASIAGRLREEPRLGREPFAPGKVVARERREPAFRYRRPERAHEVQVEMQVVEGVQPGTEDFIATVEMPQVGARIV